MKLQLASFPMGLLPASQHLSETTKTTRSASRYTLILITINPIIKIINFSEVIKFYRTGSSRRVNQNLYCSQQQLQMFDKQKLKELQQRSHTRGLLSKEFYHGEQVELELKRKKMKEELDRQVQERRRKKQMDKEMQERKMRKEEEDIKSYYRNIDNREKKTSINQSSMKNTSQPYQTYPNQSRSESRVKQNMQQQRGRNSSKPSVKFQADIPLLPVMPADNTAPSVFHGGNNHHSVLANSKSKVNAVSSGAIPLLDLSQEQHPVHAVKTKKTKKSKREKTLESQYQRQSQLEKVQMSRPQQIGNDRYVPNQDRRSTLADEDSIMGSAVRAGNSLEKKQFEGQGSLREIEEVQHENNSLRIQLRKNQEAISLLMGAVGSNGKLQKFKAQAEKILSGSNMQASKASRKQEERKEEGLLPRINLRSQSIMHDYLISAHKRAKRSVGK